MDMGAILIFLVFWVLIVLLFADAITYGMAEIITHRSGRDQTVDYFIAGMRSQPLEAFGFMFDLPMLMGDTLKLLPYSQRRAHFSKMTDAILEDVAKNHYKKVRIFAISVGAIVPYYLGERLATGKAKGDFELKCYLISPCQTAQFLKPKVKRWLTLTYPLMVLLVLILGPLAFIPIIPGSNRRFSVALMVSQVEQFLFRPSISMNHRRYVKGVIMARLDECLENSHIHAFYARRQLVYLDGVKHSDTIGAAKKHRVAVEQILMNPHSSE